MISLPPEFVKIGLMSFRQSSYSKYLVIGSVLDKHCKAALIKQVLPRFFNPQSPYLISIPIVISYKFRISSLFHSKISIYYSSGKFLKSFKLIVSSYPNNFPKYLNI